MKCKYIFKLMEDEDDKLSTTLTVLAAYMLQHINMLRNDTTLYKL